MYKTFLGSSSNLCLLAIENPWHGGPPTTRSTSLFFKFESKFQGRVITENGEITFKDFKIGKNFSINFNAKITEFGERGKIQFNVTKTFQHKTNLSNMIEIKGYIIPANEKVVFTLCDDCFWF